MYSTRFSSLFRRRAPSQSAPTGSSTTTPMSTEQPKHPARCISLAIVGCGQRGRGYAQYALQNPLECKVLAVAEPRIETRRIFVEQHKATVEDTLVFSDWKELVEDTETKGRRVVDAVVVAVQDHLHAQVVLALAELGYDIMCEKPMATSVEDCLSIYDAVHKAGIIFGMGHVMRYSPYSKAITAIIDSGQLGQLVNAVQVEPVGHYHFAHSYVRGNWHSEKESSFTLMTKSCHDIDILCRWMLPAKPTKVSSFGSLTHFRRSSKPTVAGDSKRCLDCPIKDECPYSAKRIYFDAVKQGHTGWPVSVLVDGLPDLENVTMALRDGPYGVCVYESPNDVVDHQVVNIEYSTGCTVSFTLVAFTEDICERQTRLHFSHGEIIGNMSSFTVTDFRAGPGKRRTARHSPPLEGGGHGGGDLGLIRSFVQAVREQNQAILGTDPREILESHMTVFAAEDARKTGAVINVQEFENRVRKRSEDSNV